MLKAAAETKESHRVARRTGGVNIACMLPRAGDPVMMRARPPRKRESPVALMEDIVGLIIEKRMIPIAPLAVAVSMRAAPRRGFPAPAPGA